MPKFMQFGMIASDKALDDAGWYPTDPEELERTV